MGNCTSPVLGVSAVGSDLLFKILITSEPFVQSTWSLSILVKNKIYDTLVKIGNENIVMASNYSSLKLKTCKKRLHFPHLTLHVQSTSNVI